MDTTKGGQEMKKTWNYDEKEGKLLVLLGGKYLFISKGHLYDHTDVSKIGRTSKGKEFQLWNDERNLLLHACNA